MFRSKKLLRSVRDLPCMSCGKEGETVPAHANWHRYGKGAGLKAHDWAVAALCQRCHALVDGREGILTLEEKHAKWHAAWIDTVQSWFEMGVIQVK